MSGHAVLSPSAASRWLECTPSARLEQQFPDTSGAAAAEGTLAHALAEWLLRVELSGNDDAIGAEYHKWLAATNPMCSEAMLQYCENYTVYVMEKYAEAQAHTSDAVIKLETKVDLTAYVPDGYGTVDVQIIADKMLRIIDLKYGKGVSVSAVNNRQMMLYAVGVLEMYDMLYDIDTVAMAIYQPRIDNISEWEISKAELLQWAENELKPRAKMAFEGMGDFLPGKHCGFCKAKGACKALADYNLQLAAYEFKHADTLSDDETADILSRADMFTNWLKAVEDYALQQALSGKRYRGYKLVEGRSVRVITDKEQAATTLLQFYGENLIYKKELQGITYLEKLLGKKPFEETLGKFIAKPPGKPTLVPESDKRSELNSLESAIMDFEGISDE